MNRFALLMTALLLLALLQPTFARILTRREPDHVQDEEEDRPLLGGYEHLQNTQDNPMVQEAADFALQAFKEEKPYEFGTRDIVSVQVVDAWQQVVQGMNFQLTLLFRGDEDCVGACVVQIYNQFGKLSVTNWNKELSCEEVAVIMQESEGDEN